MAAPCFDLRGERRDLRLDLALRQRPAVGAQQHHRYQRHRQRRHHLGDFGHQQSPERLDLGKAPFLRQLTKVEPVPAQDLQDEARRKPGRHLGLAEHALAMRLPALSKGRVPKEEAFGHAERLG